MRGRAQELGRELNWEMKEERRDKREDVPIQGCAFR
jgi:hypothetical protein